MSFRRNKPSFSRSPSMIVRADVQRNKTQNGAWRKRQQTLLIAPRKFQGVSLFEAKETLERKNIDLTIADLALTAATNAFTGPQLLNGVAQGTNISERVGRRILFKSMQYRFQGSSTTGTGITNYPVRVLVVYDRSTNGAAPLNTDVLQAATFTGNQLLGNADRFVILSDEVHNQEGALVTIGKVYRKLSLDTVFGGTGATVASILTGGIFAFFAYPGQVSAPTINVNFRLRYVDA